MFIFGNRPFYHILSLWRSLIFGEHQLASGNRTFIDELEALAQKNRWSIYIKNGGFSIAMWKISQPRGLTYTEPWSLDHWFSWFSWLVTGRFNIFNHRWYGERKNDKNDKRRSLTNEYKYDKIAVYITNAGTLAVVDDCHQTWLWNPTPNADGGFGNPIKILCYFHLWMVYFMENPSGFTDDSTWGTPMTQETHPYLDEL